VVRSGEKGEAEEAEVGDRLPAAETSVSRALTSLDERILAHLCYLRTGGRVWSLLSVGETSIPRYTYLASRCRRFSLNCPLDSYGASRTYRRLK
jgi:hypothetical protein